jgi:hypothetical protein
MPLTLEFGWHSSRRERDDEPGDLAPEARLDADARPAATA